MLQLKHLDGYVPILLAMPHLVFAQTENRVTLPSKKILFRLISARQMACVAPRFSTGARCRICSQRSQKQQRRRKTCYSSWQHALRSAQTRYLPDPPSVDLLWVPLLQLRWLLLGPLWETLELEAILSSLSVQKQISNEQQQLNQRSLKLQAPDCQPFCLSEFSQQSQLCENIMQHQHPFFNLCGRNVVSRLVWQSSMCKSRSVSIQVQLNLID